MLFAENFISNENKEYCITENFINTLKYGIYNSIYSTGFKGGVEESKKMFNRANKAVDCYAKKVKENINSASKNESRRMGE